MTTILTFIQGINQLTGRATPLWHIRRVQQGPLDAVTLCGADLRVVFTSDVEPADDEFCSKCMRAGWICPSCGQRREMFEDTGLCAGCQLIKVLEVNRG